MTAPTFTKRNCPITAAFVLAWRTEFGEVKVTYVNEGGVTIGTPAPKPEPVEE